LERMVDERTKEIEQAHVELLTSARLASMGRLGAAIAHQLANHVAMGSLMAETIMSRKERDSGDDAINAKLHNLFDDMRHTIESMRSLMSDVARSGQDQVSTDVNCILQNIVELASLDCRTHGISVNSKLGAGIPPITANKGDLEQVFLNLINNAIDAMPDGGKIFIETRKSKLGVEIAIRDTGMGIPPEKSDKIFEPFLSTSKKKGGLGLGLPIAHQIVVKYGGDITFESQAGKGTEFLVRIPLK